MLTTKGIPSVTSAPRRELSDYTGCVTDELPASSLVLSMRGSCTELTEAAVSRAAAKLPTLLLPRPRPGEKPATLQAELCAVERRLRPVMRPVMRPGPSLEQSRSAQVSPRCRLPRRRVVRSRTLRALLSLRCIPPVSTPDIRRSALSSPMLRVIEPSRLEQGSEGLSGSSAAEQDGFLRPAADTHDPRVLVLLA